MTSTMPGFDFTLPERAPELLKEYDEGINPDTSSFAVYSLVPGVTASRLQDVSNISQQQYEECEYPGQLARPAKPTWDFAGRSLIDIVAAHGAMDKENRKKKNGGAVEIAWYPNVFVVVTKGEELRDHGLLLVYAHPPNSGDEPGKLDKFFFDLVEMFLFLTDVTVGSHGLNTYKKWRDIHGEEYRKSKTSRGLEDH